MRSYQLSMIISLFGLSLAIGKFVYGELADLIGVFKACLYLASKMGKAVRGQVLQVCNGAFL